MLISQLAKTTNLPKDTIRYYTKIGLLKPTERDAGSRRYAEYGEDDVNAVNLIRRAQMSGFTLHEIRLYLYEIMNGDMPPAEVVKILQKKLADILEKQKALKETEKLLREGIDIFSAKANNKSCKS